MDKYEKIRVVGRGAYGTVYLCSHLSDNRLVIIKQIPVEQMTKEERLAAVNEVKVLSMMNHPYIIEYYENFLEDKALMIVMEYAQGGTLFEYIQQRNGLLLEEQHILMFLAQMLLSLQHVHSKQILHRDLKTQNILLDKKKEVIKIGDFGISKVLTSKSKAYTVVGTPCYISPELCEGKPYNQKSDIWALGCVLYELVTLKKAFEAQNLPALVLKIMKGTFEPVSQKYSEDLKQLILKMLHLDPAKRPSICQIMAQPIVLNALMGLYTDFGKVPCARVPRQLSSMGGMNRGRRSHNHRNKTTSGYTSGTHKPSHALRGLSSSMSMYCWGGGVKAPCSLPLPTSDALITQVAAGRTQKAAVTKNGRLLVWEALGVVTEKSHPGFSDGTSPAFVPRFLEGQSAVSIQQVACGDLFTACLTDRGILMTFGSGSNGCLGHGHHQDVSQAKIVEQLLGFEVIRVSCGASHVMAVTNEHEVFGWGRGENGRLGLGDHESHASPQKLTIVGSYHPIDVVCSADSSMVLTKGGQILCCGSNRCNKLYLDDLEQQQKLEEMPSLAAVTAKPLCDIRIRTAALGTKHSAVITDTGECYTFGCNQFGQLGYPNNMEESRAAHHVHELQSVRIKLVSCGDTFTIAASRDGRVFSWGKAAGGRLGRPPEDIQSPRQVIFREEDPFTAVSISSRHVTTLLATKPRHSDGSTSE